MKLQNLKRFLIGRPLTIEDQKYELLPKWKALAVLSSDALSSVAYATEEILIPLAAISVIATNWSIPIALAIIFVLLLVTLSYRQTIKAYPCGGGAYIVAKENLGYLAGLIAGGSLLIDYILTVAVSVASGVENIASAFPWMQEHLVFFGVIVIVLLMVLSLRGIGESSTIFAFPCYFFLFSIAVMIITGIVKSHFGQIGVFQSSTANAINAMPSVFQQHYPELSFFIILKAFSSGCTALTGVEAISNGIPLFKTPSQSNARKTLLIMSCCLAAMFFGITYCVHIFHLTPSPGNGTLLSHLAQEIFGRNPMYYLVQASTALILFLAASTSYADFPRLSSLLAKDRYLPRQLGSLGDKLVFSNGIIGLSLAAILLIFLFGGKTHNLIPLYAVGVFLSFTLSQAGMVVHHFKLREPNWIFSMFLNGIGMFGTAIVLVFIAVTKFQHGAWLVIILIPSMVLLFLRIHSHYIACAKELSKPLNVEEAHKVVKTMAIVPISGVHQGVMDAVRYARTIAPIVRICYVELDSDKTASLLEQWNKIYPEIKLVVLKSPYRSLISPLINYVNKCKHNEEVDFLTIILPEFIPLRWYHHFLHNQSALWLRTAFTMKRNIVVTSVRYHLKST